MRVLLLLIVISSTLISCSQKLEKPNILWITTEDITTMLGTYGDTNARTPHLDAFAEKSVKYTNAFASAPVCMPARSCIITGVQSVSLGTQHLRSDVDIPEFITPFPILLREAGYFVTNNDKEDYGFTDTTIWNYSSSNAHWRLRDNKDQPFFSVFNLENTHQSGIFGDDEEYDNRIKNYKTKVEIANPNDIQLPPYFPDSPGIRKLWARYYTNVSIMDLQFKEILDQLEQDGLTDNTIVFYYADHGTGMPRSKRALYDSGLKVPFLVHAPKKYAKALNLPPGTVNHNMVSFVDLAPTILELTGAEQPELMQGQPFISWKNVAQSSYVFGTSDRVDEAYEMARTVRTPKFRYVRNFLPFTALLQPNYYSDQSEIMKELEKFRSCPDLTPAQAGLFRPEREPEELYDVENDPYEVKNLANDPAYNDILKDMRQKMEQEILRIYDTGFMPEPEMNRLSQNSTPYETVRDDKLVPLQEILSACNLVLGKKPDITTVLEKLNHPNGFVRYWAVISVESLKLFQPDILNKLQQMLDDDFATVQIEAAKTLVKAGNTDDIRLILDYMQSENDQLLLYATRAFEETWKLLPEMPAEFFKIYGKLKEQTEGKWKGHDLYAFWSMSQVLKDETMKPPDEVNYGKDVK